MRRLLILLAVAALPAWAVTVDRIAAVVDRQVLTVSQISQIVGIRFFPSPAEAGDAHRRQVLEALIALELRHRDLERYGAQEIPRTALDGRMAEIRGRFAAPAEFEAELARSEMTLQEVEALATRQLEVEAYIQERFAPLVVVSADEVDAYYEETWSRQRRERGLPAPPLGTVRDEVRAALRAERLAEEVDRWTSELRTRATVDVFAWR